jgi:hypothetical protein
VSAAKEGYISGVECRNRLCVYVCVCMFRPRPEPLSCSITFLRYGRRNRFGAAVTGQSGSTVAYVAQSRNRRL